MNILCGERNRNEIELNSIRYSNFPYYIKKDKLLELNLLLCRRFSSL